MQVFNIFYTIVCGITTFPWFWAEATICDPKVATWLQELIVKCHQFQTSWHILQFVILWLYIKWLCTIKFYIIVSFCNLTVSQRTFYISDIFISRSHEMCYKCECACMNTISFMFVMIGRITTFVIVPFVLNILLLGSQYCKCSISSILQSGYFTALLSLWLS